jgi:hypothetical protein
LSEDSALTVTTTSNLHGERTFRRVTDGTKTGVAIWQGTCAMCGAPFEVKTPQGVVSAEQSKSFCGISCPAHRLTPAEVMRLRFTKAAERRDVFEAIKARKLAHSQ